MARDYAKRSFKNKKSRKKRLFLWLLVLLLCAICMAFFKQNQLTQHYPWLKNLQRNIMTNKPHTKKTLQVIKESQITPPKFSFYDISPQKTNGNHKDNYELKIAITENFAAADRLKAELALLGFAASITPIYEHNIQKYYVSIGPYINQEEASKAMQKLQHHRTKSELKKLTNP